MTEITDPRLKKLRFRAWHRGFKEADILFGRFADARLAEMSPTELDAFEHLLEQPDQDLYGWVMGRAPTPAQFESPVMDQLRGFDVAAAAAD